MTCSRDLAWRMTSMPALWKPLTTCFSSSAAAPGSCPTAKLLSGAKKEMGALPSCPEPGALAWTGVRMHPVAPVCLIVFNLHMIPTSHAFSSCLPRHVPRRLAAGHAKIKMTQPLVIGSC